MGDSRNKTADAAQFFVVAFTEYELFSCCIVNMLQTYLGIHTDVVCMNSFYIVTFLVGCAVVSFHSEAVFTSRIVNSELDFLHFWSRHYKLQFHFGSNRVCSNHNPLGHTD